MNDKENLLEVLNYVLGSEEIHFDVWVDEGNNPSEHIYFKALMAYKVTAGKYPDWIYTGEQA